jgi:hypothetical protein
MKKVIGLLAVFAVVISLAGCQKTPDTPVVISKNYEQMMKLALSGQQTDAPVAEQVKAPERYTLDSPLKNAVGNLEVSLDAAVIVPDTSKMTTARVSRHSFTLEECAKYVEVLFGGQKTYSGQLSVAKPALQKRIDKARKELQEAIEQKDEKMQELCQATLEKYAKEMASYGEGDGLVEAPVAFTVYKDNYNEEKLYLVSDGSDGIYRSLRITNHDAFRTYELLYNVSGDGYSGTTELYSMTAASELHFGTEMIGDPDELPDLIKSEADAVSDADRMLADLGIRDFRVKNTDTVFGDIHGEIRKAYRLSYTRVLNGASFNYNYNDVDSGMAVDDGKGGKAPVWGTEELNFIVTDEGVVQLEMLNPLNIDETVTEYTKMKDFESIMDIFRRMILIVYANVPEGEVRKIRIERIELGLMRVLEPDSLDSGVIIPVWDFYGPSGETYLTINAIDGSTIDRTAGY